MENKPFWEMSQEEFLHELQEFNLFLQSSFGWLHNNITDEKEREYLSAHLTWAENGIIRLKQDLCNRLNEPKTHTHEWRREGGDWSTEFCSCGLIHDLMTGKYSLRG